MSSQVKSAPPLTVPGSVFKAFWADDSVWVPGMYVDEAELVVNGVATTEYEVEKFKNNDLISVQYGVFINDDPLPPGHLFAGKADGELADLFSSWVATGNAHILLKDAHFKRLEVLKPMPSAQLLNMFHDLGRQAKPLEPVTVDRALFEALVMKMERQMSYLAYDASCHAATIETLPKSWSGSTKTRFINLAQNALNALEDKSMQRVSLNYLVETQRSVERLTAAIAQAQKDMSMLAPIEF